MIIRPFSRTVYDMNFMVYEFMLESMRFTPSVGMKQWLSKHFMSREKCVVPEALAIQDICCGGRSVLVLRDTCARFEQGGKSAN